MIKRNLLVLTVTLMCGLAFGQIQDKSRPFSFENVTLSRVDLRDQKVIAPTKSIAQALLEDETDEKNGIPPRFGLKVETDMHPQNSGKWIDLPNGARLWRLPIKSPGALSISLLYDKFHLPPGGKMHIYNSTKTQFIGAFTEINNKGNLKIPGKFATGLVYGDIY